MALPGFTGKAYNNATTLIITFVVNNYQEESKMAEVMAWERSFVEYMKMYINDSSHANLTIHYSTPLNVQHKLRVWWTYRDLAEECDHNVITHVVKIISSMIARSDANFLPVIYVTPIKTMTIITIFFSY